MAASTAADRPSRRRLLPVPPAGATRLAAWPEASALLENADRAAAQGPAERARKDAASALSVADCIFRALARC